MEALDADPAAAGRALRHAAGGRRQQGRQAEGHPRRAAHRQARLAGHRLRPRRPADRPGDPRALQLPRRGHAGDVHRAGSRRPSATPSPGPSQTAEYARLYAAAVARRQADQIYNLSLTRTATVILGRGARGVIGVGRVKTPTLAIVCKRELEIRNFVPVTYFEVVATAKVAGGEFKMRHAPKERILKREDAEAVAAAPRASRGRSACGSRTSGKDRPGCTTCPRCRSCAPRASAGRRRRRWRWRRSSMTARARRSSPIPAPRCATCRRA